MLSKWIKRRMANVGIPLLAVPSISSQSIQICPGIQGIRRIARFVPAIVLILRYRSFLTPVPSDLSFNLAGHLRKDGLHAFEHRFFGDGLGLLSLGERAFNNQLIVNRADDPGASR